MAKGIWVFAEVKDANIRKITFELLSQGRKMAGKLGEELVAVLLGSGVENPTFQPPFTSESLFTLKTYARYPGDLSPSQLDQLVKSYHQQHLEELKE